MTIERLYKAYADISFERYDEEAEKTETVKTEVVALVKGNKSRLFMELENGDYYWLTTEWHPQDAPTEMTEEYMRREIEAMIDYVKQVNTDERLAEIYEMDYYDMDVDYMSREEISNYFLADQLM